MEQNGANDIILRHKYARNCIVIISSEWRGADKLNFAKTAVPLFNFHLETLCFHDS